LMYVVKTNQSLKTKHIAFAIYKQNIENNLRIRSTIKNLF